MAAYTVSKTVEDGIERIVYTPHEKRFETPILMQHGMWHGAWCWWLWQETLAECGWESVAISLPGHGESPVQRPIRWCTLSYYLNFLAAEIERLPRPPVLMGHSMGGALTQWTIKHKRADLPAYVLVAPWVSHSTLWKGTPRLLRLDFWGVIWSALTLDASVWMRNPARAARALISEDAVMSPEDLHARLGPESFIVLVQHNPPFWRPARHASAPMLWLAGEQDAFFSVESERRSAQHYGADFHVFEGAGHNLQMDHSHREVAGVIHGWLQEKGIG